MEGVPKTRFLSVKQQRILWNLHAKKIISFEQQKIYKDRKSFNSAMRHMEKIGLIKKKPILNKGNFENGYFLTWNGVLLVEEFIWYF